MSQRLMCDVDMVEEQQLRQLEGDAAGGPPTLPESMAVPLTPGGASSAPCTRSKHQGVLSLFQWRRQQHADNGDTQREALDIARCMLTIVIVLLDRHRFAQREASAATP